jgi:hypothetical protein
VTTIPSLPDLSAITSVTSLCDATTDSVVASLSTGSFIDPIGAGSKSAQSTAIVDRVDLSEHAKAILAQAATDRDVANRLQAQVQAGRGHDRGTNSPQTASGSQKSIFDQIYDLGRELASSADTPNGQVSNSAGADVLGGKPIWQQKGSADNIAILQAGAQLYNRPQAMEDIAKNGGQFAESTEGHVVSDDTLFVFEAHSQIAQNISSLRDKGLTDQAQALSAALQNGTLKFQNASDVPDLNMNSTIIHYADAGGGGEMGSTSLKPAGAIKAALDGGQALALSMGDRGNFYVTW